MLFLPCLSGIIIKTDTRIEMWRQLNNVDAGHLRVHLFQSPTGLLTKARQQFMWSYLVHFLQWSKIIIWIQPKTGPQLSIERSQRRKSGQLFGPPSWEFVSWKWKNERWKIQRLQQVKGLGKSWWRVARYTSKVIGLGMARALHWKSIHGTKYLECLVGSFPQRL